MEVSGQIYVPAALTEGKCPGTNWIGGRVSPRSGLDAVTKRKRKTLLFLPEIEPRSSKPLLSHYTVWAAPDPSYYL